METRFILLLVFFSVQNVLVFGLTGGTPVTQGEFPFLVSIINHAECHICSGTIIGDRWILTSNICYSRSWFGSISFGVTKSITSNCSSFNNTIQRSIDDVLYNPNASDRVPYTHDLVLIHLNESIPFGDNVQPVKLPELDEPWPANQNATILGWTNDESSTNELNLQKAQIPLYSDDYCSNPSLYDGWTLADPIVMKCGGVVNETYYCTKDYGGPVLVNGKQYGIISYIYGFDCGPYLGIFSPVSYFREWIQDTTGI